jgi:hypothetical protein
MRYCLLLAHVVSIVAAAELSPIVRVGLLDVSAGAHTRPAKEPLSGAVILPVTLADVAFGVRVGDHFGAALGTSVLDGYLVVDVSYLPVRGWLLYDFSPARRWSKLTGFLSATYKHHGQGWSGERFPPHWNIACGGAYTFYAVTPHAEIGYDWHWRFATFSTGVAVGGFHIFR